jgi:hypothetical protein
MEQVQMGQLWQLSEVLLAAVTTHDSNLLLC